MRTDRIALFFCGCVAIAALGGCPGTLDDKARFLDAGSGGSSGTASGGPCSDVPTRVFTPSCGGVGCHGAMSPQQGLDLVSPGVAARVVGVAGKMCSGILADPANPASSLLYTKLLPGVTCGAQMPLARPVLPQSDVDCIKTWIGAQGTGTGGATSSSGGTGGASSSSSTGT